MAQNFTLAYQCLSPWQKEVLGEPWGHCVRNMKGQEEGREEQEEMRCRGRLDEYRREAVLVSYYDDNAAEQITQHSVA